MTQTKSRESPDQITARWTKHAAIFNGFLAITNIVVAVFVGFQLYYLREQVQDGRSIAAATQAQAQASIDIATDALKETKAYNNAEMRPWLTTEINDGYFKSDDPSNWSVTVEFKNIGKTPALKTTIYGALQIHEFPLSDTTRIEYLDPNADNDKIGYGTLLPTAHSKGELTFARNEIPKNLSRLKSSSVRLYAVGHLRYYDATGERHVTPFCTSFPLDAINAIRTSDTNDITSLRCENAISAD
jgi:hypothetical protein